MSFINISFPTFFSNLQEAPWYRQLLNPVINEIEKGSCILDIGTGSGKMLQLLYNAKQVTGVGIDTKQAMLDEAKTKLTDTDVRLQKINAGENYAFKDGSFDCITICNVLFNLQNREAEKQILSEALRVVKKTGKIIVLTPTGKNGIMKLTRNSLSFENKGIYIWYIATKKRAKKWADEQYLKKYSLENNLKYKKKKTLKGFAQIEIISK